MTLGELGQALHITRTLVAVDCETTGPDPTKDRIVSIGIQRANPDSDTTSSWESLVNPGIPIPEASIQKHGKTDAMVADAPSFMALSGGICRALTDVDFLGYNVAHYDLRLLEAEFARVMMPWSWEDASVLDPQKIFFLKYPRTLEAAVEEFCGRPHEGAHDALTDCRESVAVLAGQLRKFADLPRTVKDLGDYCFPRNPEWVDRLGKVAFVNGEPCLTFGKWANVPLRKVPKSYFDWMIKDGTFSGAVRAVAMQAARGVFPSRPLS